MRGGGRVLTMVLVGTLLAGMWQGPARAAERTDNTKEKTQTIQGEIVDPAAYLKDGKHGAELSDQTSEAVNGGQTLAILEDGSGSLYLLLTEEVGEDPNELVYDYANQQVKVTGTVYERGGLRGIVPTTVVPLTPPSTNDQNTKVAPE